MTTRTCNPIESTDQAMAAKAKHYAKSFALTTVKITSVDHNASTVNFIAAGCLASFTSPWSDPGVWTGCPTTISSVPGQLPEELSRGQLLVGEKIYNSPAFAPARPYTPGLKWPLEGGLDLRSDRRPPSVTGYTPVELQVDSIDITAAVIGQSETFTFDLLKSTCPNDRLNLSEADTTLNIQINRSTPCKLTELQILSVSVCGMNLSKGLRNKVDIRDPTLADPFQIVDLANRSSITFLLSQHARARFGVHPAVNREPNQPEQ